MNLFGPDRIGRLQACADVAIWKSHQETFGWIYRRDPTQNPPEEDFVASLIVLGLPRLDGLWRPLFRRWNMYLSLSGVFCHQTPKASFNRNGAEEAPELADLLVIRRHEDAHGHAKQVAVLIQAKMSLRGEIKLSARDPQLHLYTTWPEFTLQGQKAPSIRFALGRDRAQAIYSGIRKRPPDPHDNQAWAGFCPWAMMPPQRRGWVEDSLSSYLLKLLNFETGREFYQKGTSGCHWSELIHYLLETTFSLPLRTRDMALPNARGVAIGLNRTGFLSSNPELIPAYIPASRTGEIRIAGAEPPSTGEAGEAQFEEGGQGRLILIETAEIQI